VNLEGQGGREKWYRGEGARGGGKEKNNIVDQRNSHEFKKFSSRRGKAYKQKRR